jgi:predicted dehydrogenase
MERPSASLQRSGADAINRKPLRVGVIGFGVGAQHAAAYQKHPGCRVTMLCDLSADKLKDEGRRYPDAARTDKADTVLTHPELDVVSIATFDDAHYAMVLKAFQHGKHVFVEKPLCQTRKELRTLHQEWKRHNGALKLGSNLVLRTAPLYRWLKERIAGGDLGEIYAFDADYLYGRIEKITGGWRKDVADYSAMQGGGVHMMDLLFWLTGQKPSRVRTWGNRIATRDSPFRYNDYMAATLECASGMLARITANFGCVHRHQHVLRVFGTKSSFIYDDAGARLHLSRDPAVPPTPISLAPKPATQGELIDDFISAVLSGSSLDAETQTHFDVMSALIASDESLAARQEKEIAYL